MALELSLSSAESNDNITLIITDDAGTYDAGINATGWGYTGDGGTNVQPDEIDGTTHTLTLDVVITTADGTETTYDQIDLYDEFGTFTDAGDLVYPITSALLLVSSVALGTATDILPDGLYDLTYTLDESLGTEDIHTEIVLVYGIVKALVYEKLRALPTQYLSKDCITRELQETTLCGTYLTAIEQSAYVAKTEELLSMLGTLNSIVVNGSKIVW